MQAKDSTIQELRDTVEVIFVFLGFQIKGFLLDIGIEDPEAGTIGEVEGQ